MTTQNGSLEDLQSFNVVVEGGGQQNGKSSDDNDDNGTAAQRTDPTTDFGDCFVELRANLKQQSGFLKSIMKNYDRGTRIEKSYNMPFE